MMVAVIDRAFKDAQDDQQERWWNEDIQRLEARTDSNDQDREVKKVAHRIDRRFSYALVIIDRYKVNPVMVGKHRQGKCCGKRKAVWVHGKKAHRHVFAENAKTGIQVRDLLSAQVFCQLGKDPFTESSQKRNLDQVSC